MLERRVIGSALRALREEADLTTRALAEEVDVTPGHLRNIEGANSSNQPSGPLAYRLARVLSRHLDRPVSVGDFSELKDTAKVGAA